MDDLTRLALGEHATPHSLLGVHASGKGLLIRAMAANATSCTCVMADAKEVPMDVELRADNGVTVFVAHIRKRKLPLRYRLRFEYADGATWERADPYRHLPTVGDVDLHLFNEGTHRRLWKMLGAHPRVDDGEAGTAFAVWAPSARRVSVVGDFCGWDGRAFPMRAMGASGVFELFLPDVHADALYKFEILTSEGELRLKADPFAFKLEQHPGTASIVVDDERYEWRDGDWMQRRQTYDAIREPMSIYEVHIGSWARVPEEGNRSLSYRELGPRLADHVVGLGFTHVELMPVMEHPFYGSWGYQVSGYYAPSSRYGTPDDFRSLVDCLHERGLGVILDWVPAHFPRDDFALRRFDGSALYEHEDPRLGEHPDWGTLIFNFGRTEVRNFLVANALYWLEEFHADGLRVDAVASMLYLDYSRKPGEWVRNAHGGRENLEAIAFLREMNAVVHERHPGCVTIAEESTSWGGVTAPVEQGGLGFTFKWNMGWMHDTLQYFERAPVHRRFHQDELTFAMLYEFSEHFIMPLSHDEVVHLKGSLYEKMPGDHWQRLANLRLLYAYMFTRPGKKLLMMGSELAPECEWNHEASLDWHLGAYDPLRAGLTAFVSQVARLYRDRPEFASDAAGWQGFGWIDNTDRDNSVMSYQRCSGTGHSVVALNLTPVPRNGYRIGAPSSGRYRTVLSTDDARWGGSGYSPIETPRADGPPMHGFAQSMTITLPPLAAVVMVHEGSAK